MEALQKLELLKEYMNYFINHSNNNHEYYRIIVDKEIRFPRNYECIKHDKNIEVSNLRWNQHPREGWGTKVGPQKIIGKDIEIFYLNKWNSKILTFEEFLKTKI